MKTMRLGGTELRVSRVGFGGIPIQRLAEEDAVRLVRRCLDLGVTFFDTAHGYTTSEERIGKAIAGRRHELVLATKTPARDKKTAEEHLALSLRRLGTDYVDVWQLHNVNTQADLNRALGPDGAMEAARAALRAGTIRHIGISSHSLDLAVLAVASGDFETVQVPFNFVADEVATSLLPLARQHDVGVIAMKPFAGGMLGNARLALGYLLQYDVLPDPGLETIAEAEEIAAIVADAKALSADDRAEIARVRGDMSPRFCHRCEYCQPCPEKIAITTVLHLRSFWKRFPPERFFGGNVAAAVAAARRCTACGTCEGRCPYQLPIRAMLRENIAWYEGLAGSANAAR